MHRSIMCTLTAVLAGCSKLATAPADPPTAAVHAVCRPHFLVDGKPHDAGTAFLVEPAPGKPPLLITALHLFGPDGGLDAQIASAELPARAKLLGCDRLDGGGTIAGGPALTIAGAVPYQNGGTMRDVAAFQPAATDAPRLRLAEIGPSIGGPVWLVAQVANRPAKNLLHRAKVEITGPEQLQFGFAERDLELRATSGAPIVDAAGTLVGINIGSLDDPAELAGSGDTLAETKAALARVQ